MYVIPLATSYRVVFAESGLGKSNIKPFGRLLGLQLFEIAPSVCLLMRSCVFCIHIKHDYDFLASSALITVVEVLAEGHIILFCRRHVGANQRLAEEFHFKADCG